MSDELNLAEDVPMPFLKIDPESLQVEWLNHAAQEHFGMSLKSIQGKVLEEIFEYPEALETACRKVNANLAPVKIHDFPARHHNDRNQDCDVVVFPTGSSLGVCIHYPDPIPSSGQYGGQTMTAMGRMLAHEIKNPLAGINGAAQLLRHDIEGAEGRGLLDLILSEIDRIRRLADRMERLGDADPDLQSQVNIHEVLQQARRIMEPSLRTNILFSEHYDPSVPDVLGDRDTLTQAVINLIKNAIESIEASGVGNEIRLETAFATGMRHRVDNGSAHHHLPILVRVSDNGPGVDTALKDRLFQPFTSTKPSGQGLGLALVSKVISAHGGKIEVQSQDDWTIFSMMFPVPDGPHSVPPLRNEVNS